MPAQNSKKGKPRGKPFPPGVSGNPGGAPVGKRISTWMLELGDLSEAELKRIEPKLTVNGKIALSRIRAAMRQDGERSTEIILDRTEGKVVQPIAGEIAHTKRIVLIFPEGHREDDDR